MGKKCLTILTAIAFCALAFASCTSPTENPAPEESADTPSAAVSSTDAATEDEPTSATSESSLYGTYLSYDGDGAVLTLREDGTFAVDTTTVLTEIKNSKGESVRIVETVEGNFARKESKCSLQISGMSVVVQGLDEDKTEMIDKAVELLAQSESEIALYTRLFSGETVNGQEIYGEEEFGEMIEEPVLVMLNLSERAYSILLD